MIFTITLPYPPSVNSIWRASNGGVRLSEKGRNYYAVAVRLIQARMLDTGFNGFGGQRIELEVVLRPPDKRKRDIGNTLKVLEDCLTKAKVFDDDEQIDRLMIERDAIKPPNGLVSLAVMVREV